MRSQQDGATVVSCITTDTRCLNDVHIYRLQFGTGEKNQNRTCYLKLSRVYECCYHCSSEKLHRHYHKSSPSPCRRSRNSYLLKADKLPSGCTNAKVANIMVFIWLSCQNTYSMEVALTLKTSSSFFFIAILLFLCHWLRFVWNLFCRSCSTRQRVRHV